MFEEQLLKAKEVANKLGVSIRGVWRLVSDRQLKPVTVLSSTRFLASDVNAYIERIKKDRQ